MGQQLLSLLSKESQTCKSWKLIFVLLMTHLERGILFLPYCYPERIIYDDSCHLKKYCVNRILKKLTAVSKKLGKRNMVVDKLQFRNLLDLWCKPNGNPHDRNELYGVSVSVRESISIQTLFDFFGGG